MANATVLVVDDDALIRWSVSERLRAEGYRVLEADTATAAIGLLPEGVDLVLLDHTLPETDAMSVLRKIKAFDPDILVGLLTACARIETALEAMNLGAFLFANTPLNLDDVATVVSRALENTRLRRELRQYRASAARPYSLHQIVGNSRSITALRHLVARVATSPASTVLLSGERGTGKDLVARVIHYSSERAPLPFVAIPCAALPDHLLERELFGHERGAFTGAQAQRKGLLETAEGGTLFLDEIAETTPALQARLLRVLEDKTFTRGGGAADIQMDVRIVAATNRDLEAETAAGRFRSDLFRRLNLLTIATPPLRTHAEDVPLLVEHFVEGFNAEFSKRVLGASPGACRALQAHGWPGNVRELRNVVERAMLLCDGGRLEVRDVEFLRHDARSADDIELPATGLKLEDLERSLVLQAVRRCGGNQTRAGALLGLNRDQIRYRLEKFGLSGNV
jgi:two-component system, NtrC family, response regulator AtoC